MTELPADELDAFIRTIADARSLAVVGHVRDGYCCLLAGMERALEQQDHGEPWGRALVPAYRLALDCYGAEWGLKVE